MSDWDRQTTPGGAEGPQWVSAAEAADVAGVTPGTVRYWARNGLIVSEVVEGPAGEKTLVRLDEVLQHARQEGPGHSSVGGPARVAGVSRGPAGEVVTDLPARTSELAPILKSIPEIMAQLTAATDRAARAETKVEFLSAQLADLRRRLAEAEEGRDADTAVVLPEAWEEPDDPEDPVETLAVEVPDTAPSSQTWPAPPADELRDLAADEPVVVPEPGPEAVDWTSRDPSAGPADVAEGAAEEPLPEVPAAAPAHDAGDLSLRDIWNQTAAPTVVTPDQEGPEPGPSDVDWHEPATATSPPPPPRPANAPVPDGDDFYGPRRRRWFRRRR